jgi:DNA polymerase-3 subunit alpha
MGKSEFVHLHNHSEYSLLDGIIRFTDKDGRPAELLRGLVKDGAKGMALTDHGNMYGAVEFYDQCREVGLNPIIGMEAYFSKGSRTDRGHSQKENCHLTLLSRDYAGYQNLMELSSKAFLEGYYYDPRIDRELLSRYGKGLVAMSGCLKGELAQSALRGDLGETIKLAVDYRDRLEPGCFFLEIMDHGLPEQKEVIKVFLEVSKKTGIPLAASNDCHFVKKSDAEAQDARICIATGRRMDDGTRLHHESREYYYKSPEEMTALFSYAPEACANTLKIAQMCSLQLPRDQMLLPEFQVPKGTTQDAYLEELCLAGLKERFSGGIPAPHQERLKYELGVIKRMGFSGYFLIVWDFIKHARSIGVPVGPGRGSGAGALVAYALRITNLDPIEHALLFERFLNPDRKSMPDLDIDFADTGRERVIEYVRNKYGSDNVAQIITFGSLAAKLVVRDVGRVLGVPLSEVDRLAKLIPNVPGTMLYEAIQKTPELAEAYKNPQYKKLLDLSLKLEGLKRHTGVHAAGTIITKEPVVRYSPLARGARETVTTQYDGNILPSLGLLKVDFLGLRTLTIIDNAIKSIRGRGRPDFDIDRIPMDDAKSFELLRSGKALGVFQLDSQGIRDLMVRVKPTEFSDIVALIALYRPGPMKAGMLDMFVNRKHGREKVKYDNALMEPVLKDTYGCMLYQEQIMEISKRLADFTPGEADGLRKAMSKKVPEALAKMRDKFVKGCAANKISGKLADKVYDQMEKFGGYGFNKSHSAAYGLVAYQTAYLKANHPLEFMSALATSEIGHSAVGAEGKENKLVTYLDDAKAMGIAILPPSIQTSGAVFTIEDPDSIRFGLTAVKNVGAGAVDSILQARGDGPFKSLDDFCSRVDLRGVNKKVIESLIKAGAMDALAPGLPVGAARGRLLAAASDAVDRQQRVQADLSRGQGLLFGLGDMPAPPSGPAAPAPSLHEHDVLAFEKEVLGFYFSGHPLLGVRSLLRAAASHEIARLGAEITKPVRLAGMISQVKRMVTKKDGKQYAKGVLEDLSGEITLLVFPQKYAEGLGSRLKVGAIVCVEGKLLFQGDGGEAAVPEISVQDILPLETAASRNARSLRLACDPEAMGDAVLTGLREVLESRPGPCPVILEHETPEGTALLELDARVTVDKNLLESITKILGDKSWRIESAS